MEVELQIQLMGVVSVEEGAQVKQRSINAWV